MKEKEIRILTELIDREINNFIDVSERTGRDSWMDRVKELESIKNKLTHVSDE
jgi:hypothetical protein